jgi:hypothetical protein
VRARLGRSARLTQEPHHCEAFRTPDARLDMFGHGQGFSARERANEIALDSDDDQLTRPSNRVIRRVHLFAPVCGHQPQTPVPCRTLITPYSREAWVATSRCLLVSRTSGAEYTMSLPVTANTAPMSPASLIRPSRGPACRSDSSHYILATGTKPPRHNTARLR